MKSEAEKWNEVVFAHAPLFGAFLQSYEWGEFQSSLGRKVKRVESEDGKMIAQAIRMPLPFGFCYDYFPKGPLGEASPEEINAFLQEHFSSCLFLRLEPPFETSLRKVHDIQPATTLLLDLMQSEENLLAAMKPKTRYNIRLGKKKGVECRFVSEEHFGDFIRLMEQTSVRDDFRAHHPNYYKKMLEVLRGGAVQARLAMAFFEGRALAANIVVDFGDTRTYLHGATSNVHRNVMAQYVLHDFLILEAQMSGMKTFDFWGIAPESALESHPWKGITRYKESYGGQVVSMPGTYDLPVKPALYTLYRVLRTVQRFGRN